MQRLSFYLLVGLSFVLFRGAQAASVDGDIIKSQEAVKHVVLLSLDGFRHDYIDLHDAKNIKHIADEGVRATSMQPVLSLIHI